MSDSAATWPPGVRYEFVLAEAASERVLAAFPEFRTATAHGSNTVLFGPVADPTELRGLLARFDTLGLTVLEMRRLPD
ncbi:hypothetical protein OG921_10205 [Aldersonia sp. NBC_00410]|uniref:hypothetical protein n=1 Tax=Aldersonia sp. NBC_00410 TaxID=2975954 RepID=UPI00225141C2|nr:hypothetical protein [Aldersonia sp. NBC_00410]MCX5043537.1 hypothetical protein [Aldersonia sp. NBC_00410]